MGRAPLKSTIKPPTRLTRSNSARERDRLTTRTDAAVRELIDKFPAAIFIFQANKNLLVNPCAAALTGYNRDELLQMYFWEIIHPDYRLMIKQRGMARQRGVKVPPRYELKILRKDGEERWLNFSGAPIRFHGKMAVMGTAFDITKRKLAEERLHRQLQDLQSRHKTHVALTANLDLNAGFNVLLEKIDQFLPFPVVCVIRKKHLRTGNPEVTAFRNINQEDWLRLVPHGGRGLTRDVLENKKRVMVENAVRDPRIRFPELFRQQGLVSYFGLPLIRAGKVLGDIAIFTKTKHRFSEREVEFIESLADQGAMAIDNLQLFEEVKRRSEELAILNQISSATTQSLDLKTILQNAIRSVVELLRFDGARVYLFDHGADEACAQATFEAGPESLTEVRTIKQGFGIVGRVRETGEAVIFEDIQSDPRYDQLTQTGGAKMARYRFFGVFPIRTEDKSWGALACMMKEPRHLNNDSLDLLTVICNQIGIAIGHANLVSELRHRTADLEKAKQVRDEFLGVMSHELRSPLQMITGYMDLIRQDAFGELPPELRHAFSRVEGQTTKLFSLIEHTLVTTNIVTGMIETSKSDFDLTSMFMELRAVFAPSPDRDVQIIWDTPSELPIVRTDGRKVTQILKNLIDNAIKFTESGRVTVTATYEPNMPRITFKVRDTGIGISIQDIPHIFEMFQQVDSSATRSHEGIGLGLYVVKAFTELLGGAVNVESEPGKGSTFIVSIPCAE
jgi:PAS domain S-box-containing protein